MRHRRTPKGDRARVRIYEYIVGYRTKRGFSPTVREMSAALEIPTTTIYYHLKQMQLRGELTAGPPRMARTWAYVEPR
jgi:predicted transcriptional regulator